MPDYKDEDWDDDPYESQWDEEGEDPRESQWEWGENLIDEDSYYDDDNDDDS